MGREKYGLKIRELFARSPVVSYQSIAGIVNRNSKSKQYAKQLIHHMLAKGNIQKLSKGYYTKFGDPSLAVYCFQPAYLGLQDALSFHNLWEQETIPIIITTRKARNGIRTILGTNVLIRRMEKKYYFGIDYSYHDDITMPYSDVEKTFIDMVYFKEKMMEEVIKNFRKKIDKKKLGKYLMDYPVKMRRKVLSFLL